MLFDQACYIAYVLNNLPISQTSSPARLNHLSSHYANWPGQFNGYLNKKNWIEANFAIYPANKLADQYMYWSVDLLVR